MKDRHLSVRVSEGERLRVELAAGVRSVSRSEFVREVLSKAAERELDRLRGPQERDRSDG